MSNFFSSTSYQEVVNQAVQSTMNAPADQPSTETVESIVSTFTPGVSTESVAYNYIIKPGVVITMNDSFPRPDDPYCWASTLEFPAFCLLLSVSNKSTEQFSLRFESDAFSLTDNLGTAYEILTGCIRRCSFTDFTAPVGTRRREINSGTETNIYVAFQGEIGVNVQYLILTVENLSGVGPIRLRKDA